jgi:hypothetical protein
MWRHFFAPTYGIKSENSLRYHIMFHMGYDL